MNERFKEIREYLHLTKAEFARALAVSWDAINMIETNRCNLSNQMIQMLVLVFNVNSEWIRTGEGTMFKTQEASIEDDLRNKFIQVWNSADDEKKQFIFDLMDALKESTK